MVMPEARGSSPFVRVDGLPQSLGARGCALGHTDGLPRSPPGCQELWPNLWVHDAGTCFTDEHKARGRQRAGATGANCTTTSVPVRAYVFQVQVVTEDFFLVLKTPNLFSAPNYYRNNQSA